MLMSDLINEKSKLICCLLLLDILGSFSYRGYLIGAAFRCDLCVLGMVCCVQSKFCNLLLLLTSWCLSYATNEKIYCSSIYSALLVRVLGPHCSSISEISVN